MGKYLVLGTLLGLAMGPAANGAQAREVLAGPIAAQVTQVIDGDTFVVLARIWLGQEIEVRIRLDGVDTPEMQAKCSREAALAEDARRFTAAWLNHDGGPGLVTLQDVRYGKYAGRVIAKVRSADGSDLGRALIDAGLAQVYDGGTRPDWCGRR